MEPNGDLVAERERSSIDVEALTNVLDGGVDKTQKRHKIEATVAKEPVFSNDSNIHMTHQQRYRNALQKAKRYHEMTRDGAMSEEDGSMLLAALGDGLPTFLHYLMFVPNIKVLCNQQQQAYWLPRCEALEVVGCYAQTELGHGSNIRALETTATFIAETDEFEIHSPTITSTKWWPGTLGRTANHAMVIAQLIIGGKSYGIHNFIVPVRCIRSHKLLKGVDAGDIGPKIGFHSMDNGFCRFTRVRIPRANMAMGQVEVTRDGQYRKVSSQCTASSDSSSSTAGITTTTTTTDTNIAYLTMTLVRVHIVTAAARELGKACTIGVRYSAVRRQGFDADSADDPPKERQVLDYTTQLYRLVPPLAASYAFFFMGNVLSRQFQQLMSLVTQNSQDLTAAGRIKLAMSDFHATSSGLKSFCSSIAAEAIEDIRRSCGGHGYLSCSGLPELLGSYLQNCTVEGENHMLTQQTTRFLLKQMMTARKQGGGHGAGGGSECNGYEYLGEKGGEVDCRCAAKSSSDMKDSQLLLAAFEHRSRRVLQGVEANLTISVQQDGLSLGEAWNRALLEIYRASRAHCMVLVFRSFMQGLSSLSASVVGAAAIEALRQLLALFGLYWIEREMGDFSEDGYLSAEQTLWVRQSVVQMLHQLRPDVVALVDAWDVGDALLQSTLGRKDGRVYEALMESARNNPLNAEAPVPLSFARL